MRGFADQRLRNEKDPLEASNRRISIIVQYISRDIAEEEKEAGEAEKKPGEHAAAEKPKSE